MVAVCTVRAPGNQVFGVALDIADRTENAELGLTDTSRITLVSANRRVRLTQSGPRYQWFTANPPARARVDYVSFRYISYHISVDLSSLGADFEQVVKGIGIRPHIPLEA